MSWTLPVKRIKAPERERFASKFTRRDPAACWEWLGTPGNHGYGTFVADGRRRVLAHRYSYEMHVGPIPPGLQIDHLCRNRLCVNPYHLEAVTPEENKRRGQSILALNARKTHCKWGHEFTDENTARVPKGRHCKACHRLRKQSRHPGQLARPNKVAA